MIENPLRSDLCRSQIRVRFDDDIQQLIDDPYGNHVAFAEGDIRSEIEDFFNYLTR